MLVSAIRSTTGVAATLALMAGLAGCSSAAADSGELRVVTSTNVYADIVGQVAGDDAKVTAIIDDPNQDPHSYEATTHDRLFLSKADLVVMNGGGYDSFMTALLDASGAAVDTIDVVAISGLPGSEDASKEDHAGADHAHADDGHDAADHAEEPAGHEGHADEHAAHAAEADEPAANGASHDGHDHGSFNEHLWYSVPTMTKLVAEVATHLGEMDPAHRDDFRRNASRYTTELDALEKQIDGERATHGGEHVGATEPVPLRLFDDMGLVNVISPRFLAAVEEGNDVPPLVLREAQAQVKDGDLMLLGFNSQASGPQAELLRSTAESAGIPVVDLSETMPADTHYVDWMGDTVTRISTALEEHDH